MPTPQASLGDGNSRLAAARRLTRRQARRDTGRFLVEGTPAVTEALRCRPDAVVEIFATAEGRERNRELLADVTVAQVSPRAAAALSETATPQGLIAVCRGVDVPLADVFAGSPHIVALLVCTNDPGNAGAILRTADAAGADAVVFAGGVDLYNGKLVRASAGSLFHLDVVAEADPLEVLSLSRAAGMTSLAATGRARTGLDALTATDALAQPTMWIFGNEAHGLTTEMIDAADRSVRIPIYGAAESLNLAAAAAVCLYASALARRRTDAVHTDL